MEKIWWISFEINVFKLCSQIWGTKLRFLIFSFQVATCISLSQNSICMICDLCLDLRFNSILVRELVLRKELLIGAMLVSIVTILSSIEQVNANHIFHVFAQYSWVLPQYLRVLPQYSLGVYSPAQYSQVLWQYS